MVSRLFTLLSNKQCVLNIKILKLTDYLAVRQIVLNSRERFLLLMKNIFGFPFIIKLKDHVFGNIMIHIIWAEECDFKSFVQKLNATKACRFIIWGDKPNLHSYDLNLKKDARFLPKHSMFITIIIVEHRHW